MRKIKRFTVGLLLAVTACLMAVGLTGCTQKGDREKQDVHVCTWEVQSKTNATCTKDAVVNMICKECGETQEKTLPETSLGHEWESDEVLKVPATCRADAYIPEHYCVLCNAPSTKKDKVVLKGTRLPHDGDKNADDNLDVKDLVNGKFVFTNSKSREPNCQEQAYCGTCGMFYGQKLSHSISLVVFEEVKPTCTQDGHVEYVECVSTSELTGKQCTYTTYEIIHKTGHDGEKGVEKIDEYGNKYDYFDNVLDEKEIAAIQKGTKFFEETSSKLPTCTSAAYCGICQQAYGEYGHKMTAATCEKPTHCTVKGCTFTQGVALGHLYQEREGKLQTCEEEGWGKYLYCTRCAYSTQEILPALGHEWRNIPAIEATCTEVGREGNGIDCARCHVIQVKPTTINALGHDGQREGQNGVWYVGSYLPDCTHYGYCALCQQSYGENVTGYHQFVTIPAQAATCEQDGWNEYEKCIYCSYSTYADHVIPRLPHSMEYFERVEPTCTQPGREEGWACRYCSVYELLELRALGHDGHREDQTGYIESDSRKPDCENSWGYCGICKEYYTAEVFTGHEYRGDECIHCGKKFGE